MTEQKSALSDNIKLTDLRRASDVTNDSGRGSVCETSPHNGNNGHSNNEETSDDNVVNSKRLSLSADTSGYLQVPHSDANAKSPSSIENGTEQPEKESGTSLTDANNSSLLSSSPIPLPSSPKNSQSGSPGKQHSPSSSPGHSPESRSPEFSSSLFSSSSPSPKHKPIPDRPVTPGTLSSYARTKHAPKIVYSHSEDRLTIPDGSRPICPSLPYSPYQSPSGSPRGSPRLRRQPTRETRSLSISDSDGYTQLNQYKLKDEIGKVGCFCFL